MQQVCGTFDLILRLIGVVWLGIRLEIRLGFEFDIYIHSYTFLFFILSIKHQFLSVYVGLLKLMSFDQYEIKVRVPTTEIFQNLCFHQ